MLLHQLLDVQKLADLIKDGYIREGSHWESPDLRILNYSVKTVYEKVWCLETSLCRGLIFNAATDEIVARPWAKFFNYGEHPDSVLDLGAPAEVTDKMDGSLGILYRRPDNTKLSIATRGAFDSGQARRATRQLEQHLGNWSPLPGYTYLFEVVFPENRIVLDYGDRDGLVLLGGVETETGRAHGPQFDPRWPGERTTIFPSRTLAEALAMPPRSNAEGLVVRCADGKMVKLKQEDYLRLHKLISGLSNKAVWEYLSTHDGTFHELLEDVPDEFHSWVRETAEGLLTEFRAFEATAMAAFDEVIQSLPTGASRKEFALKAVEQTKVHPGLLFARVEGRSISPAIWKAIRPVAFSPMKDVSEE